jgi:hypothetical protein
VSHEAEDARDEGIARVTRSNKKWMAEEAMPCLLRVTPVGDEDISETFRLRMTASGLRPPTRHQAWGALMRHAARAGWFEQVVGDLKPMVTKRSHARRSMVWRRVRASPPSLSPLPPLSPDPVPFLPDTEGTPAMPLQLTITASSLEELWQTLSTFPQLAQTLAQNEQQERAGQGFVPADTAGADTGQKYTWKEVTVARPNGGEEPSSTKRGPGRPAGSTNKPKAAAAKPEPEPGQLPDDTDDTDEMDEGNEDAARAAITQELGKFWKKGPGFKNIIQGFRSQLGISTMLELQAKDFPKARKLIEELKAASD